MIITEGTQPSRDGKGYCRTPGIYNDEQVNAWRNVTDAVHQAGGRIVLQIMHCGRIAHPDNKAADAETVAPSAIAARGDMFTEGGMKPFTQPRALRTEEIPGIVEEYRLATANAYAAGFDGVELHGTSGYLPAQFLSTGSNQRSDDYGGSLENRLRFVLEVLAAMISVDGADRVGLRICPGNPFNDLQDDNPEETFAALLDAVNPMALAYLHVIRMPAVGIDNIALARGHFDGPLIVNDSYKLAEARAVVEQGIADAVSFGRAYISNPDLVSRFKKGAALNPLDPATLYSAGPKGLIDYPMLS
jgi:N-ethylmaleimide reductase